MLGRSLDVPPNAEPITVLRGYLSARTDSATELAAKAVVLISPERLIGKVAWPHPSGPALTSHLIAADSRPSLPIRRERSLFYSHAL